jgi:hypothetical protein
MAWAVAEMAEAAVETVRGAVAMAVEVAAMALAAVETVRAALAVEARELYSSACGAQSRCPRCR